MLWIKDTSTVPPEDWTYLVEQTGFTVRTKNYNILYQEVVKHCKINGVTPPSQEDVIKYVCANATVPCYDLQTPLVNKFTLRIPKSPRLGCCGGRK